MTAYTLKIVTRPGQALGFRLAGVGVHELTPEVAPAAAAGELAAILADPTAGVIAIEETLLPLAPKTLVDHARLEGIPVLVPFAMPGAGESSGRGRQYITALIESAIGYHVKFQR